MSKYHSNLIDIRKACNDTFMCNYNFMPPNLRLEKDNHKLIYAKIERDINHDMSTTNVSVYSVDPIMRDLVKNLKKCGVNVTYTIDIDDYVTDTEFGTGDRPKFDIQFTYRFMKAHKAKQ